MPSVPGLPLLTRLILGLVAGFVSSFMVNCSIIEISVVPFFAVMFSLLFFAASGTLAAQGCSEQSAIGNRCILLFFSACCFTAGFLCAILERGWPIGMPSMLKIPLYSLLGSTLSFTINFSLADLMIVLSPSFGFAVFFSPLINSRWKVRLLCVMSAITGCMNGFVFGLTIPSDVLETSPDVAAELRRLMSEQAKVCYPISACVGAFASMVALMIDKYEEAADPDLQYLRKSPYQLSTRDVL